MNLAAFPLLVFWAQTHHQAAADRKQCLCTRPAWANVQHSFFFFFPQKDRSWLTCERKPFPPPRTRNEIVLAHRARSTPRGDLTQVHVEPCSPRRVYVHVGDGCTSTCVYTTLNHRQSSHSQASHLPEIAIHMCVSKGFPFFFGFKRIFVIKTAQHSKTLEEKQTV